MQTISVPNFQKDRKGFKDLIDSVANQKKDFIIKCKTKRDCKLFASNVLLSFGYNCITVYSEGFSRKRKSEVLFNNFNDKSNSIISIYGDLEDKVVAISFEGNAKKLLEYYKSKKLRKKIIPDSIQEKLEKDNSQKSMEEIEVPLRIFHPMTGLEWYIYEHLENDIYMCFANLNDPMMAEIGTVSLSDLMNAEFIVPERDKNFQPKSLKSIFDSIKGKEENDEEGEENNQLSLF